MFHYNIFRFAVCHILPSTATLSYSSTTLLTLFFPLRLSSSSLRVIFRYIALCPAICLVSVAVDARNTRPSKCTHCQRLLLEEAGAQLSRV